MTAAALPGKAVRRAGRVSTTRLVRGIIGVVCATAIWAVAAAAQVAPPSALVGPVDAFSALVANFSEILSAIGATLWVWAIALALAAVTGTGCGLLVGFVPVLDALSDLLVRLVRSLPVVALLPIAILVVGLGSSMNIWLVTFAAFWPVFINARNAARSVDQRLIDTGLVANMSRVELAWRIYLPASAPLVISGINIAAGLGLVVAVSIEVVTGARGIGGFVVTSQNATDVAATYAGILAGGLLGWIIGHLFRSGQRRLVGWSDRGEP